MPPRLRAPAPVGLATSSGVPAIPAPTVRVRVDVRVGVSVGVRIENVIKAIKACRLNLGTGVISARLCLDFGFFGTLGFCSHFSLDLGLIWGCSYDASQTSI